MHTQDHRTLLAWIYLRQVIEASNAEILDLLWPDGWYNRLDPDTPTPDVRRIATMIKHRDPALPKRILDTTARRFTADPRQELEHAHQLGYRLITPGDQEWPASIDHAFLRVAGQGADKDANVRGQAEAPFALWARGKGNLATLSQHSITIVGSREPTTYGKEVTSEIAGDLAINGYCIVSGGARGVDYTAHKASLTAGGATIAALACGLDVDYPKQNQRLFHTIERQGAIISEYPLTTRPARHRFLTRNRLVAALSLGTVVTQAGNRSGALNTLNWAETMFKPAMAVPGPVTDALSQGCLNRIRNHRAELVATASHIQDLIQPAGQDLETNPQGLLDFRAGKGTAGMSLDQLAVYDSAGIDRDNTGQLSAMQEDTGLPIQIVMRIVNELETKGYLRRVGDRWIKQRMAED